MRNKKITIALCSLTGLSIAMASADYIFNQPQHGAVASKPTGVRYTPSPNYVGSDKLTLKIDSANTGHFLLPTHISVTPRPPVISGIFLENNIPFTPEQLDGTIVAARGFLNGKSYNFDAILGPDGLPKRIVPVSPTRAIDIIGYPTSIIEGYPR